MLLEREEVNPDKLDNYGITPLSCAASGGYEGIVNILLGRGGVNPDSQIISAEHRSRALLSMAMGGS